MIQTFATFGLITGSFPIRTFDPIPELFLFEYRIDIVCFTSDLLFDFGGDCKSPRFAHTVNKSSETATSRP
ncbi:hypothetical protein AAHC03_0233 [Spirometra sp. Aus1]